MINIMYAVDPIKRIVKPMSGHAVTEQDHEASSLRFAFPDNIPGTGLESTGTAVRVMYIRPDGGDPVAKTLTFYKHSGGYYLYDWDLQKSDLSKEGALVFSLCILDISGGEVSEWHTTPCAVRVLSTIHTDDSDEGDDTITPTVKERVAVLESMIQRVASGAPIVVASTSDMTDTEQIYVLSTNGQWYYHNGSAWVAGGEYGGVTAGSITTNKLADGAVTTAKIADGAITAGKIASGVVPAVDATLTQTGAAADAKATGDALSALEDQFTEETDQLKADLGDVETGIFTVSDNLFNIDDIYTNEVPNSVGSSYDAMVALNGWYTSNYIPVTEGEQYTLVYLNTITQGAIFRIAGYSNGIMTYKTSGSTEPNPFTIPSGVDHVRFYSNTANLFNNRTNTSFKKYSAGMSMVWAPYGKQENFLVKGAMPEYGVYVDGTNYYHFVRFGEKTLIRLFKQEGPNNLFQFSSLYTGEISEYGVSIDETIATNGTDTVGPISIMRQGVDSGGMWTGGWHTRTVNGVVCPTAEQQSLDISINGKSIVGADGLHYGECVATVVNKLYFAQTITGADLSMATQAIQETVTYILNEKMTARVAHKYVADTRVILYYGMQAVRIGFDNIILPNNETAFAFADMTANINLDKPEDLMQMSNNDWNYDLLVKPFGLAKYTHNSGAGPTKYGYLPTATRKVYWALMEGTYDYTFITSGKVLVWEGVWDIYPN